MLVPSSFAYAGGILRNCFTLIGRHSFEIMACHFLTTKIVDLVYARVIGEKNKHIYGVFVCAYSKQLWIVYAIVGTLFVALFFRAIDRIKEQFLEK